MRDKTKWDSIDQLPANALRPSQFARKYNYSSGNYVVYKYSKHKFGHKTNAGNHNYAPHPGYDLVDFAGTVYVINYT